MRQVSLPRFQVHARKCITLSVFSCPLTPPGQMTQLCELINKSGELLAKNLSHLDTVLGALDIQEHSLGVLAVL